MSKNIINCPSPKPCATPAVPCSPNSDFQKYPGGFSYKNVPFTICVAKDGNEIELNQFVFDVCQALNNQEDTNTTYSFSETSPNVYLFSGSDGYEYPLDLSSLVNTVTPNATFSIAGDIITVTPNDGTASYTLDITHPTPPSETNGVHVSGAGVWDFNAGTITYPTLNDTDESVGPNLVDNTTIPALIQMLTSTPHPEFQGVGDVSAVYNSATNTWVISVNDVDVDTDTRCTFTTLANGQIQKTAITYTNGVAGSPIITIVGNADMSADEFCQMLLGALADPVKAAQVNKILQATQVPLSPVCEGPAAGGAYVDGKLYFNADGTNKLEVYDGSDFCLKPYSPLIECMCIELEDGTLLTLDSVTPQVWTEKEGPDYFEMACGLVDNPDSLAKLQAAIDTNTNVTYDFGEVIDDNPNDGIKKLVLNGSDGSSTCVLISDSTELPDVDTNTTYTITVVNDILTLTGTDGNNSSVIIETFDENFVQNPDGSYTFTDDDGDTVNIPRPLTNDEICAAVLSSLTLNPTKLQAYKDLIDTNTFAESVSFQIDAATNILTGVITLSDGTIINDDVQLTDITLTPGTYVPNANGIISTSLTDGTPVVFDLSSLISDPDIDFVSTTISTNATGESTVSYLDSNGDIIDTTIIPSSPDLFLADLELATDGCTLIASLSNGVEYGVEFCNLISNITETVQADGSTVYTHITNGVTTTWTVPGNLTQPDGTIVPRNCVQPTLKVIDFDSCQLIDAPKDTGVQKIEDEAMSSVIAQGITPIISDRLLLIHLLN